jgi:hypothetical protein
LNRNDLRLLCRLRLREARALLQSRNPAGAYYLAGYAVECALKACIAKRTRRHDFPDQNTVKKSFSHNLNQLVGVAGLPLEQQARQHTAFAVNWALAKDWHPDSRYDPTIDMRKATDLYRAITNRRYGVLQWLRKRW